MADYQRLYQLKTIQCQQLTQQFLAFQCTPQHPPEQSSLSIEQLQKQNSEYKNKNIMLMREIELIKEKRDNQVINHEKEYQLIRKQRNQLKYKFEEITRKVIDLQNINQSLEAQNRAANYMLEEYQLRVEKTMEQLALVQVELEQRKLSSQEQIEQMTRLKNQLKQTEQQLFIIHLKHQKHNEEIQYRRSRLLVCSGDISQQDDISSSSPISVHTSDIQQRSNTTIISVPNIDFRRNKQNNFSKTIMQIKNLINDIDSKARRIKDKKKGKNIGSGL